MHLRKKVITFARMIRKLVMIVCLLAVSLLGDAKIVVPDSMLTITKAYTTTDADTSLAIIQTMRQRGLAPQWLLDMAEGDYLYATLDYTKSLTYFKRAYASEDIKDSIHIQMELLKRLIDTNDVLYNEAELVDNLHELRLKAQRCKNDAYLSMVDFTIGKRKYYHRKKDEGYELCVKALDVMKNSDYVLKEKVLCNYYAELLQMYMKDGRYEDALRMSLLQEEATRHLKGPQAKNRETLRYVYALRASLLSKAGLTERADQAYENWKKESNGNSVIDAAILDYLIDRQHYQEAHDIIHHYCEMLRSQQDNYSFHMIRMLTTAVQVEGTMGLFDNAAKHAQEIRTIVDSLHINKSESLMQTTWGLIQSEEKVAKTNVILNVLGIILVMGMGMGAVVLYYTRLIRHRNKHMLKMLNALEAYRKMAVKPVEVKRADAVSPTGSEDASEVDDNERLFVELDGRITNEKLFLKPTFGRDDMARLIGVDKNRIGRIMSKYSNASNASVYINTKRVEYGAKLLLDYPEYTVAAIAIECGMTNTVTFNRTFKEIYGMTPSEYRSNMVNMLSTGRSDISYGV